MVVVAIVFSAFLIVICLYGIVHVCRMANGKPRSADRFTVGGWNAAVREIDAFTAQALKVYAALDPEERLWRGEDGLERAEPHVEVATWTFDKGLGPEPAVFIRFVTVGDEPPAQRLAIVPFEVLNWDLTDKEFLDTTLELTERKHHSMVGDCGDIHWLIWKPVGYEGKEGAE